MQCISLHCVSTSVCVCVHASVCVGTSNADCELNCMEMGYRLADPSNFAALVAILPGCLSVQYVSWRTQTTRRIKSLSLRLHTLYWVWKSYKPYQLSPKRPSWLCYMLRINICDNPQCVHTAPAYTCLQDKTLDCFRMQSCMNATVQF